VYGFAVSPVSSDAMCPVCGGSRLRARAAAGLDVRRCLDCGLHVSAIVPAATDYATVSTAAYLESISRVRIAQAKELVAFAASHGARGEWLDVGCGYGHVLDAARAAGFRVRGIEPNADAAAAARARIASVEIGFLESSTPPADVLSTLDVIEHLTDLGAFAQLAKSKAAAFWLIKVPSSDGLFFKVAHALRFGSAIRRLWQSEYRHPHTVYFHEPSLRHFLERAGFDVIAVRYLDEVPPGTVVGRLTLDGRIPRWLAMLAVPVFLAIRMIERMRRTSDALVVLARPRG